MVRVLVQEHSNGGAPGATTENSEGRWHLTRVPETGGNYTRVYVGQSGLPMKLSDFWWIR